MELKIGKKPVMMKNIFKEIRNLKYIFKTFIEIKRSWQRVNKEIGESALLYSPIIVPREYN